MSPFVGDIVHVSGLEIYPAKGKFCVLVSVGPNRFLLINTDNRTDYDCIPLFKNGRDFPRHDSFIGCKNIFLGKPETRIDEVCGRLEDSELTNVFNKIQNSKYISRINKQPILDSIAEELMRRESAESLPV